MKPLLSDAEEEEDARCCPYSFVKPLLSDAEEEEDARCCPYSFVKPLLSDAEEEEGKEEGNAPVVLLEGRVTDGDVVLLLDVGTDPVEGRLLVHQVGVEAALEAEVVADLDVDGRRRQHGQRQRRHHAHCTHTNKRRSAIAKGRNDSNNNKLANKNKKQNKRRAKGERDTRRSVGGTDLRGSLISFFFLV